jgi:hypothetical protein
MSPSTSDTNGVKYVSYLGTEEEEEKEEKI